MDYAVINVIGIILNYWVIGDIGDKAELRARVGRPQFS